MEKSMSPGSRPGSAHCPRGREMRGIRGLSMRRMHFDEMVDREDGERHPHRRRRGRAHLEHRETDDPERKHDLEIDRVVGRKLDLAVELLDEVDDCARRMRMLGEK